MAFTNRCTSFFSLFLTVVLLSAAPPAALAGPSPDPLPSPALADSDDDGLANDDEALVGTDANNADSDADGIRDGVDPDILAYYVDHLPADAFKSEGQGHRIAIDRQLATNQRLLEAGHTGQAIDQLHRLRKYLDGCSPEAGNDDWIVDCDAQLEARRILDLLLANHVSVAVDTGIEPPVTAIPGLNGGPERAVGVALGPEGNPEPFVTNEVILRTRDPLLLESFLVKYDGIVVRDGKALLVPGGEPRPGIPESRGSYLVRINPDFSPLDDLVANMERGGIRGSWTFSSDSAARTAAIVGRESGLDVSLNFTMELSDHPVREHPDNSGGNLDASKWAWMTEDDDPGTPGDQGLSVGVIHACEYVQYKGYPPTDTPYSPLKLAVIDAGFDLDETTGEPLYGEGDYPFNLPQLDEINYDWTAGGAGYGFSNCNGCWHGQLTFGACCALSNNHYGTAGTSGGWNIRPLLIKATADIDTVNQGIYDAIYNGADVIHETIGFECGWWCRNFGGGNEMTAYVKTAKNVGAIFVTPAMNQKRDISGSDVMPCNRDGAVCVGAIDHWGTLCVGPTNNEGNASNVSNWGNIVDTWAPTGLLSTITRDSANEDPNDIGIDELPCYGGTSAATPFLTGIVALMKMVNPNIRYDQVRGILVSTANPSSDPKVKDRGYVDALRAVMAASPNLAPTVELQIPTDGSSEAYSDIFFRARVVDPEKPNPYGGRTEFESKIEFRSNVDGLLCSDADDATGSGTILGCSVAQMSPGAHVVTARVTDPFGAVATDTANITVINQPPVTRITFPTDGAVYASNQQINLRGYAFDPEVYGFIPANWSSSLSGALGSGTDIWVSLPVGDHQVTLTAIDEKGATSSDSITLHVKSTGGSGGFPQVQITQPANSSVIAPNATVTFQGQASDPEDGNITDDAAFRWTSSIDGFLGTGRTLQKSLSITGEAQVHTILLEVSDSDGNSGSHSIDVVVLNPQ